MQTVLVIMCIFLAVPTDGKIYPDCKGCMVTGECVCGRAYWITITKNVCMKRECVWTKVFWREVGASISCLQLFQVLKDPNRYAPEGLIACKN